MRKVNLRMNELEKYKIIKNLVDNNGNKKIIDYLNEYMPENYTKNSDINCVVWYFLVCIASFDIAIAKK